MVLVLEARGIKTFQLFQQTCVDHVIILFAYIYNIDMHIAETLMSLNKYVAVGYNCFEIKVF